MEMKERFDKNGFVVLEDAIALDAVHQIKEAIDELKPSFKKRTWTIPDGVAKHEAFWPIIFNQKVIDAVQEILGGPVHFFAT